MNHRLFGHDSKIGILSERHTRRTKRPHRFPSGPKFGAKLLQISDIGRKMTA